jgi:acyl-CoA synthetase (AMP-forming)/AMP-acid ligase II
MILLDAETTTMDPDARHQDLVSQLLAQFEHYADTRSMRFLVESGRQLVEDVTSFGDIDRRAREIAAWLSSRPESDRPVVLLFEPGLDFWRTFIGCLYAGVVAVPTPLPIDERSMNRVAGILRDTDSTLALTTKKLGVLLSAGIAGLGLERKVSVVVTDDSPLGDAASWTMPHLTPENVAFLQYTSGSTGAPKGVAVTHGNIVSNATTIAEALGFTDESVIVGWAPHFHDMGLISPLTFLCAGADVVSLSPLAFLKQPVRLLKAISDYRGTASAAPNFAYDLIARRVTPEQLDGLDLSSWKIALNGAEPVRRSTIERVTATLAPSGFSPSAMRPGYGLAEVTAMASVSRGAPRFLDADSHALEQNRYMPADERATSLVSSGEPAPGIEVHIVEPDSHDELPDDRVGEIWLRSDSVASGYHNRSDETIERFHAHTAHGDGPFLRTGDLGFLHDGELYVTGRIKDLVIANGRNLYPQDIEDFVQDVHPALNCSRGCAVAIDANDTERIVLIQTVKPELLGETSYDQLASTVKIAVAQSFEVPAPSVVFVNRGGIHLTTSGKVQRASMRAAFLAAELTEVVHTSLDPALG